MRIFYITATVHLLKAIRTRREGNRPFVITLTGFMPAESLLISPTASSKSPHQRMFNYNTKPRHLVSFSDVTLLFTTVYNSYKSLGVFYKTMENYARSLPRIFLRLASKSSNTAVWRPQRPESGDPTRTEK